MDRTACALRRKRAARRRLHATLFAENLEARLLLASDFGSQAAAAPLPGATFVERLVSTGTVDGPLSVATGDVDGDGDNDVVSASYRDDSIRWYDNDGSGAFTEKLISVGANSAQSVFIADVDGDSDADILSASRYDHRIRWFENDGNENFSEHVVSSIETNATSVTAADVDGDGDMDILSAAFFADTIVWFENNGAQSFTRHVISATADGAYDVATADVDDDGDLDVLSASGNDDTIAWYQNDGNQNFTKLVVTNTADNARSVTTYDVDGDNDLDIIGVSTNDDTVAWYENDGSENFTERVLTTSADRAFGARVADLDSDGDADILATSQDDVIRLFLGDGTGNFTEHIISDDSANGADALAIDDLDGDGKLDFVVGAQYGDNVLWFQNGSPDYGDAPAPYPTTAADDGPSHVAIGHWLGASRDGEVDGVPSASADGDGADEDGVTFGPLNVRDFNAEVTVNVQSNNNQPGWVNLDAWIDFNQDGDWSDPGEQIFQSTGVRIFDHHLTFQIPGDALVGTTYARFRLSAAGGLSPTGPADDGEVEDYQIYIGPPVPIFPQFVAGEISGKGVEGLSAIASGDLDKDGDLDIVTASGYPSRFEWFENQGGGDFTRRLIDDQADQGQDIKIEDFDNDGDWDIVAVSYYGPNISWYENDGTETFTRHIVSPDDRGVRSVAVGDVDGDGDKDFISAGFSYEVLWYENTGVEPYPVHVIDASANAAKSVAVADIDSDGDLDVVSANGADDTIAWYENGPGTSFTKRVVSSVANGAISVATADLDGDGDMDVLSASQVDQKFAWHENDGNENFTEHVISTQYYYPYDISVTDIDADGDLDVFGASYGDDVFVFFENDGNEVFATTVISDTAFGALDVAFGDVDGDGDSDVIGVSGDNDKLSWYANDATQSFPETVIRAAPFTPYDIEAADIDGDGDLDPVGASYSDHRITWYENRPDGTFTPKTVTDNAIGATSVSVADVDGDGDIDVVGGSYNDDKVAWHENDGGGGFTEHVVSNSSDGVNDVAVADLDGDGDLDLLSASGRDDTIAWFENNGSQSFTKRIISTNANQAYSVAVADIDGDGDLDVVSASYGDDKVAWYENDGSQNFTERLISNDAYGPSKVILVDIDGDGDLDVLNSAVGEFAVIWHENTGGGVFVTHIISDEVSYPYTVDAADVDHDGDIDIFTNSQDDYLMLVFENDGARNFIQHAFGYGTERVRGIAMADLDSDGDLDVLTAETFDYQFSWFENVWTDLGDAPGTYPTLLVDDGATHFATGPRLGATRDGEADALPSANADSDGDDEDGVLFGILKTGQTMAGVNIELQNAETAKVDAWIDFNADGAWDASEQILNAAVVMSGLQTLNYSVPAGMTLGQTYARVRVSTAGGLAPTGLADDGEVEDYLITIREDVEVTLPANESSDLTIRRNGDNVDVVRTVASVETVLSSTAIETTSRLIVNTGMMDDHVTVDYQSGGFFYLPEEVLISDTGGRDQFELLGSSAMAIYGSAPTGQFGNGIITAQLDYDLSHVRLHDFESIGVSGVAAMTVPDNIRIENESLTLAVPLVNLGAQTTIVAGTMIDVTGQVHLDGQFNAELPAGSTPLVGDSYVLIRATGGFTGSLVRAAVNLPSAPLGTAWDLQTGATELTLRLVDLAQVSQMVVGGGSVATQRSQITNVEIEFDGLVDIDADAIELRTRVSGGAVVTTSLAVSTNPQGNSVATLTFSGPMTRGADAALVDGNYQLTIDPAKVRRAGTSITLDGNDDGLEGGDYSFGTQAVDNFFALFGDADGDRDVDGQDYGRFALTYLKSQGDPAFNAAYDRDGDGDVDGIDYGQFGRQFLKSMPF